MRIVGVERNEAETSVLITIEVRFGELEPFIKGAEAAARLARLTRSSRNVAPPNVFELHHKEAT